jgi:hypothetical protein
MVVFRNGLRACSVRMPVRARRLVGCEESVVVFFSE